MNPAEFKGPGDLEAEILMSRVAFAGSFFVVEGEDDSRFWHTRKAARDCEIVIGGSKLAVTEVIRRLDRRTFRGALGIVDADFDHADAKFTTGSRPESANLLTTPDHDLEGLLLQSSALERVLVEHGDRAKISSFESRTGSCVRDALLARALPWGRLRWLSQREALEIPFSTLSHRRFTDESSWQLDESELLRVTAESCGRSPEGLASRLAALPVCDPWLLCQGHDMLHLLAIGLQKVLGSGRPGYKQIAALLRAAVQDHELEANTLWRSIRGWEGRNPPFRVLPPRAL